MGEGDIVRRCKSLSFSVFGHYIFSYIVILLIPILITFAFAARDLHVRQQDALEAANHSLAQSAENIEKRFDELGRVARLISSNDVKGQELAVNRSGSYYKKYILYQKLANYCYTNNSLNRCYVTVNSPDGGYVVGSNGTITDISFFYRIAYNDLDGRCEEWWQKQKKMLGQVSTERMRIGGEWTDVLLMRYPLLSDNGTWESDGIVFMDISKEEIKQLIIGQNEMLSFLFTNQQEEPISLIASKEQPPSKVVELKYVSSRGHVYECTLPESQVLVDWQQKLMAYWAIIALTSLLGGVYCFWAARRNSTPVTEMASALSVDIPVQSPHKNVLRYLQSSVNDLVEDRRMLREESRRRLPFVQVAFMERLLFGLLSDFSDIPSQMRKLEISLNGDSYQVAVIKPLDIGDDTELETLAGMALETELTNASAGNCYIYRMNNHCMAAILALSRKQPERDGHAILQDALAELKQKQHIRVRAALGKAYESIADVNLSYSQAYKLLDATGGDSQEALIDYRYAPEIGRYFYYPSEMELKLIRVAASGNETAVKETFQELYEENFAREQLSPAMIRYLLNELNGTYLKLAANIQKREIILPLPDLAEPTEKSFWAIEEEYLRVCRLVAGSKNHEDEKLRQRMQAYLDANYRDAGLNLALMSEAFAVNEVYMSRLFKKCMGDTFSHVLEHIRMQAARNLLHDPSRSVAQVAEACGYASPHAFRRAYKRYFGDLPSETRDE